MMRYLPSLVVAVAAVFVLGSAQAAGPWRIVPPPPHGAYYNKQAAIGAYGRAVYPKYRWGLHIQEFQNAGIPHGDIGIQGSGVTRNPW